ncbi:MAG: flagellar M-ring protein FliF [Hyphomicrobiales bacterium]|nr:flagellar M-ring protein FliF [Hyphomicrobiales bacterium]
MNGITEFVKALGPGRLAAMGAVAVGLIGFFVFLMLRLSQPQFAVLFTELAFEDSIEIVRKLEGMNVPHKLRQEGSVILVPKERVLRLRMKLAEDGLPAGGTIGYEIFDKGDTLGATSFVQNVNRLRAIEGELARTIRAIDRIMTARVHLVLPQRRLFARTSTDPSASIVVKVRGSLDGSQIKAIQHLTASAVEGLKPSRVSIVDETGKLLASGRDGSDDATGAVIEEKNRALERRMQQEILDIVESVVGSGRARVRVTAEMDYNKITQTSDLYDPEGRVVRSTQTREETAAATRPTTDEGVTVGNELPAAGNQAAAAGRNEQENTSKTEEVVNYEISRTTKTEVVESGRIKRLSVAVLVDGIYTRGADGKPAYAPRSQEDLDKIAALVRSAIGFDQARSDQVQVTNLRFADRDEPALADTGDGSLFSFSKADYFQIAELVVVFIVSFLVLIFVVRPLVRRIVAPEDGQAAIADLTDPEGAKLLTGPDGATEAEPELALPPSAATEALKQARVVGELQATAVAEIGEVVQNNPDEAVTIVREWIQDAV